MMRSSYSKLTRMRVELDLEIREMILQGVGRTLMFESVTGSQSCSDCSLTLPHGSQRA